MLASPSIRRAAATLAVLVMLAASLMSCDRPEDTYQDAPHSGAAGSSSQPDRLWNIVRQIDSVAAYQAYLKAFPGEADREGSSIDEDHWARNADDEKPYPVLARARVAELQEEAEHAGKWGVPDELPEDLPSVEFVAAVLALPDGQERDEKVTSLLGHGPAIVLRLGQVVKADEAGMGETAARLLAETGRTGRRMLNLLLLGKDEEVANRAATVLPLFNSLDYYEVLSTVSRSERVWFSRFERVERWHATMAPIDAALELDLRRPTGRPLKVTSVLQRLRASESVGSDAIMMSSWRVKRCSSEQIDKLVPIAADPNEPTHVRLFALELLCDHAPSKAAPILAAVWLSGESWPIRRGLGEADEYMRALVSPMTRKAISESSELEALAVLKRASAFCDPRELLPDGESYLKKALRSPSPSFRLWAASWLLGDSQMGPTAVKVLVGLIEDAPRDRSKDFDYMCVLDLNRVAGLGYGWRTGFSASKPFLDFVGRDSWRNIRSAAICRLAEVSDRLDEMDLPTPVKEKAKLIPEYYWWAKGRPGRQLEVLRKLLSYGPHIGPVGTSSWYRRMALRSGIEGVTEALKYDDEDITTLLRDHERFTAHGLIPMLAAGKKSIHGDVRLASAQLAGRLFDITRFFASRDDKIQAVRSAALSVLSDLLSDKAVTVRTRAIEIASDICAYAPDDEPAKADVDTLRGRLKNYQPIGWEDRIALLRSSSEQWPLDGQALAVLREDRLSPDSRNHLRELMLDGTRRWTDRAMAAAVWAMDKQGPGGPSEDLELALPEPLGEALESSDPWLRATAADTCKYFVDRFGDSSSQTHLKTFLCHADPRMRVMALWAFNDGEATPEEIEGLIAATSDNRACVRRTAALVMKPNHIALNPNCKRSLQELTQDADWTVRLQAMINQCEPASLPERAAAVVSMMSDPHPVIRAEGVARADCLTENDRRVKFLERAIRDEHHVVRFAALLKLRKRVGKDALSAEILEALSGVLIQGGNEDVEGRCLELLFERAKSHDDGVSALISVLASPEIRRDLMSHDYVSGRGQRVIRVLGDLGVQADAAIPLLTDVAKDWRFEDGVRSNAVYSIFRIVLGQ